jgi:hypothetical protein
VSGTQTWQDPSGKFNLVLPGSGGSQVQGAPGGVAVRKLGNSLGIEVPTKPGANVTVQPRANGVDLIVEGDVDSSRSSEQGSGQSGSQSGATSAGAARTGTLSVPNISRPYTAPASSLPSTGVQQPSVPARTSAAPATTGTQTAGSTETAQPPAAATSTAAPAQPPTTAPPATAPAVAEEEGGLFSYIFSYTGLAVLLLGGLVVALVLRRKEQAGWESVEEEGADKSKQAVAAPVNIMDEETARTGERRKRERRKGSWGGRRSADQPQALVKKL